VAEAGADNQCLARAGSCGVEVTLAGVGVRLRRSRAERLLAHALARDVRRVPAAGHAS